MLNWAGWAATNFIGWGEAAPPLPEGGWRGAAGEDDRPWWADIPTKPLPKPVERAIEKSAKAAPAEAPAVLAKKIKRAKVEWDDDYSALLSAMQERDAKDLADLRQQVINARAADSQRAQEVQAQQLQAALQVRQQNDALLMLLLL